MRIKAKLYVPKRWIDLDSPLRKRFNEVESLLRTTLRTSQPSYAQLADFIYKPTVKLKIRKSVAQAVEKRSRFSYTMTHEIACFKRALDDNLACEEDSIYAAALAVRSLLFRDTEPLRTFPMTIVYHDWMSIAPPLATDAIFASLSSQTCESALFGALNIYLILLTSHPFSDGNGRTSRLMFNIYLAKAFPFAPHYVPLNELTRATFGMYEEYIGNACRDGNFRQLIWMLLGLLQSYAEFLSVGTVGAPQCAVSRVLEWVKARQQGSAPAGINDSAPYLVSVSEISVRADDGRINRVFLCHANQIAKRLSEYGTIEYALTGLADLAEGISPKTQAIAFFITADRKEDLKLHFRELRAKYSGILKIQIAVASGDAVIDAKLLATLLDHYTCHDPAATSCPVLLHDFVLASEHEAGLV